MLIEMGFDSYDLREGSGWIEYKPFGRRDLKDLKRREARGWTILWRNSPDATIRPNVNSVRITWPAMQRQLSESCFAWVQPICNIVAIHLRESIDV